MIPKRPLVWFVAILITTVAFAHTTPEMDGVRLALHTFAHGLLNTDANMLASVLHDDLRTNDGRDKDGFLESIEGKIIEVPATKVLLKYALHEHVGEDVRVSPVVMFQSGGIEKASMSLTLRQVDKEWKIVQISTGLPLPDELGDVVLPEQYELHNVRVRLWDDSTGQPTHARIHVSDGKGEYWPPEGHQKNIPRGWREDIGGDVVIDKKTYAYVRPDFTLPVAEGSYTIEVMRGIEYEPLSMKFAVTASKVPELDLKLKRWSNVRQEGWYSGDTHVHFLDPGNAILEARGEDLNIVNILATKWVELITDVEHFTGGPDPVSEKEHIVYVNEETRHGFLGHTVLLNLKKLVYPLTWGTEDEGVLGGIDYPSMAKQADKAHAQGGFVSWAHFPTPKGEVAIDIALGKIDSVDLMTWGDAFGQDSTRPPASKTWYRFLNCGFRVPATGGTDKMWNSQVVGIPRTYVKVDAPFSYQGWLEGVRAGRTFVTTGPILTFSAGSKGLGETINAKGSDVITVRADVRSRIPVDKIEIVQGGTIVAVKENKKKSRELSFETKVTVGESSWIAARAYGSILLPYQSSRYVRREGIPLMAHTSPIYIDVAGKPIRSPEDATFFIKWVDEALDWVKTKANIPNVSKRQEMVDLFQQAKEVYLEQLD